MGEPLEMAGWIWWALAASILYVMLALVLLIRSFGWRRGLFVLRRQVVSAEAARPQMVAALKKHLITADRAVHGTSNLNKTLIEGLVRRIAGGLFSGLVLAQLPTRWRRRVGRWLERAISFGARRLATALADRLRREPTRQ